MHGLDDVARSDPRGSEAHDRLGGRRALTPYAAVRGERPLTASRSLDAMALTGTSRQ